MAGFAQDALSAAIQYAASARVAEIGKLFSIQFD